MNILNFSEFLVNEAVSADLKTIYKLGSTGPTVSKIQQKLIDLGLLTSVKSPTGYYGADTEAAVRAFQKSKGFAKEEQDGDVGPKTFPVLFGSSSVSAEDTLKKRNIGLPAGNELTASSDTSWIDRIKDTVMSWFGYETKRAASAAGPTASLLFDGDELKLTSNGETIKAWPAVSGQTFGNTDFTSLDKVKELLNRYTEEPEKWAKDADAGPIPPGDWLVGDIQSRVGKHLEDTNILIRMWQVVSGKYTEDDRSFFKNNPLSEFSWGNYRAPIKPIKGKTETHGRTDFYIHGGQIAGSHGCIDLTDQMNDFTKTYMLWMAKNNVKRKQIQLTVNYKKAGMNEFAANLWKSPEILMAYDKVRPTSSSEPEYYA